MLSSDIFRVSKSCASALCRCSDRLDGPAKHPQHPSTPPSTPPKHPSTLLLTELGTLNFECRPCAWALSRRPAVRHPTCLPWLRWLRVRLALPARLDPQGLDCCALGPPPRHN